MGNSARETERGRERMEAAEGERGGDDLLRMGNSNSASESAMRLFNGNNQYYKAHLSLCHVALHLFQFPPSSEP